MAKYSLRDMFSEEEKNDYSLTDLAAYWGGRQSSFSPKYDDYVEDRIPYVHRVLLAFFTAHGLKSEKNEGALSCRPLNATEPRENVFSYLKLVCYILEMSVEHRMPVKKFLNLFDNPARVNIPLYDRVLKDLESLVSPQEKERIGDTVARADIIWTAREHISLIAYKLHSDYNSDRNTTPEALRLNADAFIEKAEQRQFPVFCDNESNIQAESTYFDLFYRIVATARACAEVVDILNAFKKVKKDFSIGHTAAGEYNRMVQPQYRKVEDRDRVTLAYRNGEIIESTADQIGGSILNPSEVPDAEYLDALEKYILKNLGPIAEKVFCLERATKNHKRSIKNHINRVDGYWSFEPDRYEKHCELSKAKLISLFQVIFLSEKKTKFCKDRDHRTWTRKDRDAVGAKRETRSYSSLFLETPGKPTYRDSYSQQEICVWIDYQTLVNIAPLECATYYLDINIATLEAILYNMDKLPPYIIQKRAEQVMKYAVYCLSPEEDGIDKVYQLWRIVGRSFESIPRLKPLFLFGAKVSRLGIFCNLFGVPYIANIILEKVRNWDRNGYLKIVLDPFYTEVCETKPMHIWVSWDAEIKTLIFEYIDLSNQ